MYFLIGAISLGVIGMGIGLYRAFDDMDPWPLAAFLCATLMWGFLLLAK